MIAEKMREAGIDIAKNKLYVAAAEAYRSRRSVRGAADALRTLALRDPDLITQALIEYLERVIVPDMKSGSNASGGHAILAQTSPVVDAADTSSRGKGQSENAQSGHDRVVPARDETLRRAASLKVAAVTVSAFDFKMRDGRGLRRVQFHELVKFEKADRKSAYVAKAIRRHSPNADPFAYIPSVISEPTLKLFIEQAERENHE